MINLLEQPQSLLQAGFRSPSRDIADSLIAIAQEVARMHGFTQKEFPYYLTIYRDLRSEVLRRNGVSEAEIERFSSKCNALYSCVEELGYPNLDLLCCEIRQLF